MNEKELIMRMVESLENIEKLNSMTNEELADLLMNHVWADMELFTKNSDLISAVIDRLRGEE